MKSKKQDVSTRGVRLAGPRAWMKFKGANRFDNGFQPPLISNYLWGSCFGHPLILLVCILTYWLKVTQFISTHKEEETEGVDRKLLQSNSQEAPWLEDSIVTEMPIKPTLQWNKRTLANQNTKGED